MGVAVIGSGVSGVAVAHALAARGLSVDMLDVGETLDERRRAVVARLHDLPTEAWLAEDFALINENRTLGKEGLPKKLFFGSDAIYADDRPFAHIKLLAEGRAPLPTFAKGGFSNIWGAAVLPADDCDMADWPIARADLAPYFAKVASLMPICGGEGTLARAFPPYKAALGKLDPSPQGKLLLEDLSDAEPALTANDTLFGKARLAIHTAPAEGGILPCNNCGHCFTGCVRGSIYATTPLLDQMVRSNRVAYRPGIFVESVDEAEDRARIDARDVASGERLHLAFDAVFIACGPLNTTRVLLRSRSLYNEIVMLKESQKFVIPMLRLHGADTAIDHPSVTMASVFIETKVRSLSDHWLHLQVVPLYEMLLTGSRLPGTRGRLGRRLWSPLLRRLMLAWCGMHSDHSARLEVALRRTGGGEDQLEIGLIDSLEARAAGRRAARELMKLGLKFRTLFVPGMIKFANPGSGTHCGSSFPMRSRPVAPLDTDTLGRPFGWSRIFAVDSSVLPSIPGTTLAFTVMANAYRIGSLAPV
jgi:choline dehydrogenase-like flavoprotein